MNFWKYIIICFLFIDVLIVSVAVCFNDTYDSTMIIEKNSKVVPLMIYGDASEKPIYLYSEGAKRDGALVVFTTASSRNDLNDMCYNSLFKPSSVNRTIAFISVTNIDTIKDLVYLYNIPTNRRVVSLSGNILANSWIDLLSKDLSDTLKHSGVVDGAWWSGFLVSGISLTTCNSWTSNLNSDYGGEGSSNDTNGWIFKKNSNCNTKNFVLCVGWEE